MKTQEIKNMGQAYLSVLEAMKKKKMDPVDADELKGDHEDRDDKDIDNDGDTDKSDIYLHNRRKAISKASKGKEVETTESVDVDEAKKTISAKQIRHALSSAKAQAKPKGEVSLKKAPWDEKKESVVYEAMNNNVLDRLHSGEGASNHMGHEGGARQHHYAAEDARNDGNTKAAEHHERASAHHERASEHLEAGNHIMAHHNSELAAHHAKLAVKHGGEETDSHEVHQDHAKAHRLNSAGYTAESTERNWDVLNRILEKAHAKDSHTKGATEPEKMGSTASKDEMGFVNAHGGLTGTDSGIDGAKAAAYTASVATANIKVAPGRLGDNKAGDKNIIKPGTQVK